VHDSCHSRLLDDSMWPEPNKDGAQELEVKLDSEHVSFTCSKLGSLSECRKSRDDEGLSNFYYFTQDLKSLVFSIISMHFKIRPIP
jgi:protein mago nashi